MTDQSPRLSVVIPTRNRHDEVGGAVESALGSDPARRGGDRGGRRVRAAARAAAAPAAARGAPGPARRHVRGAQRRGRCRGRALDHLPRRRQPPAAGDGGAVAGRARGARLCRRRWPWCRRSRWWARGPRARSPACRPRTRAATTSPSSRAPADRSHMTKATLVVERDLFLSVGGFDPTFPSREMSDLFFRLNPVCSIEGIPVVTQRADQDAGAAWLTRPGRARERLPADGGEAPRPARGASGGLRRRAAGTRPDVAGGGPAPGRDPGAVPRPPRRPGAHARRGAEPRRAARR